MHVRFVDESMAKDIGRTDDMFAAEIVKSINPYDFAPSTETYDDYKKREMQENWPEVSAKKGLERE
jgi:hypothetical protein